VRLSKKAEYALRAVVAMGRRGDARPIQIQELSESEHIPVKFLEHILLALKKANLLKSKRGAGGGYQLNKRATEITLGEVIELIDGPFVPVSCAGPGEPGRCGCGHFKPCGLGAVFCDLQQLVITFLNDKTVAEVVAKEPQVTPSFEI
jgi:Rrf2 family transcriptional regulator, cysteine metabolism repressor